MDKVSALNVNKQRDTSTSPFGHWPERKKPGKPCQLLSKAPANCSMKINWNYNQWNICHNLIRKNWIILTLISIVWWICVLCPLVELWTDGWPRCERCVCVCVCKQKIRQYKIVFMKFDWIVTHPLDLMWLKSIFRCLLEDTAMCAYRQIDTDSPAKSAD